MFQAGSNRIPPAERAVVSPTSYEARKFGVGSGMPLCIAARKVPDAIILPVDQDDPVVRTPVSARI